MKKGWKHRIVTSENDIVSLKPEGDWTNVEDDEALGNSKVLDAIFKGVDKNVLRLMNTCLEDKEAWEIFKTSHEGS